MKYVLDTCTFFWLVDDQSKLSDLARKILADANNGLHVPVIVLTELHRLVRKGKITIRASDGLDAWFRKGLIQHQAQCEPITLEIAHAAEMLPAIHNDPADRVHPRDSPSHWGQNSLAGHDNAQVFRPDC